MRRRLDTVARSLARPPSGNALRQLDLAEQVIEEAGNLDDLYEAWRHAAGDEGVDATAALMEGVYRLRLRLFALDQTLSPSKEKESSDASEPSS